MAHNVRSSPTKPVQTKLPRDMIAMMTVGDSVSFLKASVDAKVSIPEQQILEKDKA